MRDHIKKLITDTSVPKAHPRNKHKPSSAKAGFIAAVIFIIAGVLFLLLTDKIHIVFPYIAGIFLLLIGSFDAVRGIKLQEYKDPGTKLLANGIVYMILGLVILYHRKDSVHMIGSLWGILGVIKSSEALNISLHQMSTKQPFYKELIRAVVELILSVLLLLDAHSALHHHIFLLGIELLVVGWRILQDAKLLKQREKHT